MADWFWVIFDTSQLMDYYSDVHNLLALPTNATMRYDYKQALISDAAMEHVERGFAAPVLLIYVQKNGNYRREKKEALRPKMVFRFYM